MHLLETDQHRVALAVRDNCSRNLSRLPHLTARAGADPYARLNVYRNNTYSSLMAALTAVFPVTARLVDERYFRYAGHRFISEFPPDEPRLSKFGKLFPRFLREFERLATMPYVAETAALEWEIAIALDMAVSEAVPLTAVTRLDSPELATLELQPSLHLGLSRWPVFSIWAAHQEFEEPELDFVRRGHSERIMLWRSAKNIRLISLGAADFAFMRRIFRRDTIERAALRALAIDPLFDLATALGLLFGHGLVTGITISRN